MQQLKVAIIFHHIGPYHHARLNAAACKLSIAGIEWSNKESYAWGPASDQPTYEKRSLFDCTNKLSGQKGILEKRLADALRDCSPDVLVINGWNDFGSLISLSTALSLEIPIVVMSESTRQDFKRNYLREALKQRILSFCSSALVGGRLHKDYLMCLGFQEKFIFLGYDAVDNTHFAQGAANARQHSQTLRHQLRLPEHFFLASARFIEKKNLTRLIQAYAHYQRQAEMPPWHLVLLGDGDLRPQIVAQVKQLGLDPWVHLPGFKQYDELPNYYGLAHCFIHASTTEQWGLVVNEAMASGLPVLVSNRCGCAPDLVQAGHNGYTFDPYNPDQLTDLMLKIASGTCDLAAMGQASQNIIAHWSPQTFADNLQKAVELALTLPRPSINPLDRALLWALSRR